MATYNILTNVTTTGTAPAQALLNGDDLYVSNTGTLNSLGGDGASSTGGDNDLQIYGTLAGGESAFAGAQGDDLIHIYQGATVLGGIVSAIDVGGESGHNTFINSGSVSTHSTAEGVLVVELDGDDNTFLNRSNGSITSHQDGTGVYLDGSSNTFTNHGSITAGADSASFASGDAVNITGGGSEDTYQSIVNTGTMTALNGDGLHVGAGENSVSNASTGVIAGSATGIDINGYDNDVENHGHVTGGTTGLYIDGGNNDISNGHHAHIDGGSSTADGHDGLNIADGENDIHNDGYIAGGATGINVDGGSNDLINDAHGHITGHGDYDTGVYFGDGENHVANHGAITGGLDGNGISMQGTGDNYVHNYKGAVIQDSVSTYEDSGAAAVEAKGAHNVVVNDGTIAMNTDGNIYDHNDGIYMSGGDNTVTNQHSGVITDGTTADFGNDAIFLSDGGNVVNNNGHITGTVFLGWDSDGDSFNGAGGTFNGTMYGGSGNDSIELGKGTSTIYGGDGADFMKAGSGADSFNYTDAYNSYGSGSTHFDTVDSFNTASDSFNFAFDDDASFDSAHFATIQGAALTDSNFDADIKADVGNHLHANSAVLLDISGGEYAGDQFLVVDGNGQAGYQAGSDYVVELTNVSGTFTASDIHALSLV